MSTTDILSDVVHRLGETYRDPLDTIFDHANRICVQGLVAIDRKRTLGEKRDSMVQIAVEAITAVELLDRKIGVSDG